MSLTGVWLLLLELILLAGSEGTELESFGQLLSTSYSNTFAKTCYVTRACGVTYRNLCFIPQLAKLLCRERKPQGKIDDIPVLTRKSQVKSNRCKPSKLKHRVFICLTTRNFITGLESDLLIRIWKRGESVKSENAAAAGRKMTDGNS